MSDPSDPSKAGGSSFDIPDLDLGAPAPKPKPAPGPQPKRELPAPISNADPMDYLTDGFSAADFGGGSSRFDLDAGDPGASSSVYSGSSLDMDEDEGPGAALELQSYHPPAGTMPSVPIGGPSYAPAPTGATAAASKAPSAAAAAHHALPPAEVDPSAARQLAGYGTAPQAFYLAPLYSVRVLKRHRELRTALAKLNQEFEAAELRRDEALANVGQACRGEYEGDSRFESAFVGVRQLEEMAGARGQALQQLSSQAQATSAQLDEQISGFQQQIAALRANETAALDEVSRRQEAATRVVAKQKRLLIEARSATQVAQQAAGGPGAPIPAEHADRIQNLQAQAAALQPEATQLQQELAAAQQALAGIRGQINGLAQQAKALDRQKKGAEQQFQGQISAQQADFGSVQRDLTRALAAVGQLFLAETDTVSVDASLRQAVTSCEAELNRVNEQRELTLRALDLHDTAIYKRGFVVAASAVVALIVLLVVLLKVL
jgi:hypothetical protein